MASDVLRLAGTYVKMMADFQEPDIASTIFWRQPSGVQIGAMQLLERSFWDADGFH